MRLSDEKFSQVFDSVERLNTLQAIKKCYDHSQLAKIAGILLGLACLVVSAVFSFSFWFTRFTDGDVGYLSQLIARQPGLLRFDASWVYCVIGILLTVSFRTCTIYRSSFI